MGGERTFSNIMILIGTFLIITVTIVILIYQVISQMAFWVLRPSETTALDVVGRVTGLAATTGNVSTEYKNQTGKVFYYFYGLDKMLCVITHLSLTGTPTMGKEMTTINCYSMPFPVNIEKNEGNEFDLILDKYYEGEKVKVKTRWS